MFLDLKDGTLCDPRSGDAGEDRRAEHRESYRHVTLLTRRTHSHCNDRRREQGPARYSSVPMEGGSHRVKALTPAHVEKGRLHHPCGSLRQLTAGWVKVGLQRRCLTPWLPHSLLCCTASPTPRRPCRWDGGPSLRSLQRCSASPLGTDGSTVLQGRPR